MDNDCGSGLQTFPKAKECENNISLCVRSQVWAEKCNAMERLSRELQCLSTCPVGLHLHVYRCSRECLIEDPYSYTKHTRDSYISLLHPLQPSLFWSAFKEIKTQYLGRFWCPYWSVLTWLHFRSQNQFIQQHNSLDDVLEVGWGAYGHQALNHLGIRSSTTKLLNLGSSSPPRPPPRPSSPPSLALEHPLGCLYLGGWSAWRVAWRVGLARQDLEKRKRYGSGSLLHYDNFDDFPSKKHIPWRGTRKEEEHPSHEKWCPVNFPWMCIVIPAWFYLICLEMPLIGNLMHPSRALHTILQ